MSELSEEAKWEDSIYQIQRGDAVSGGRDGVANKPTRQLANRTRALKNDVDKLNTSVMSDAKIYDSVEEAQAAITASTETRRLFTVNSPITNYWVEQYENVNGIATPTGKKIVTAAFVEAVELLASATDKRTRGLLTMPRSRKPVDFVSRQGKSMFSINENSEKEMPGKTFSDYMNIFRELIIGPSALRRARPGYLFNLVTGGFRLLAVRDDGTSTLEYRGIPVETHIGLLQNTLGGFGDSISDNGRNLADAGKPRGWTYNARSWQVWSSLFSNGRIKYVGQWATGGYTTADMIRDHLKPAIAAKPRFMTFLGGRNDVIQKNTNGSFKFSIAAIKDNVKYILTEFRKNGIIPVVCSMAAQNNADPAFKGRENEVNAFLRAYAREQGYPFVDMRTVTVDPMTDGWKDGYNGVLSNGQPDPSHPVALGAFHMGKALAEALEPYTMPVYPQLAIANPATQGGPNAIVNPLFMDVVAGVPTGWTVGAGSAVITTDPAVIGNVLTVTGSGSTIARVSQMVAVSPGEVRTFSFRVKTDVTDKNSTACYLEANDANKTNLAGIRTWNHSTDGFMTFSYDVLIPAEITEINIIIAANAAKISVGQMGLLKQEAV